MRKICSMMIAFVAMMCVSTVQAAVPTVTLIKDTEKVLSYFDNFRVVHSYDFKAWQRDGEALEPFALQSEGTTIANAPMVQLTTPGMENFYMGVGRGSVAQPDLRFRENYGIYEFGSGGRLLSVAGMAEGMVIVIQGDANGTYSYTDGGVVGDAAEEITEEIHAKQLEGYTQDGDGNYVDGEGNVVTPDKYRYFRMLKNDNFTFTVSRACFVCAMLVIMDAGADESVTPPSLTLARVDGVNREIAFKPGESTIGSECTTWWGNVEDEQVALYLIDTDEIDHYEYEYQKDDEGNIVYDPETQEPIVVNEIPVYKKILDPEAVAEGLYGDNQYDGSGSITIYGSDDKDGDGYVTIEAATVSSTGAYSDIVSLKVSVLEIQLNQPTLTLMGMDGQKRTYQIGWANNTLCGEEVLISAECDGDLTDGLSAGSYVEAKNTITVKVEVEGYLPSEQTITVESPGVNVYRQNAQKAEAGEHDWDFVLQDADTKSLLKGQVVDYCYIESDPDTHYTAEEYESGISTVGSVDLTEAIPVYVNSGWTWDGGRNRATLNVAQYSETIEEETTWYPLDEGIDKNANGFGYDPNAWNPFTNGLLVSCPPNTKNNSCILQYVDKADGDGSDGINELGIYFMDKPTITFPRETARNGEYVLIYQGAGGSNYTSSRWPSFHQVPAEDLLSVTLNNGGIHVFYIDVFTSDEVAGMEDPYMTGIDKVENRSNVKDNVYSLDGRIIRRQAATLQGLQPGLYIMNGKKVLVKQDPPPCPSLQGGQYIVC